MSKSREVFLSRMAQLIDEHVEERLHQALELLLHRTGKPAFASGPPRAVGRRETVRHRIATVLKTGPKSAREIRESLPDAPYRTINGTVQLCKAQGLFIATGHRGSKLYALTSAGAEFFK